MKPSIGAGSRKMQLAYYCIYFPHKSNIMKKDTNWLEGLIEQILEQNNALSKYLVILLVLFIGAGSLYVLLNTTG